MVNARQAKTAREKAAEMRAEAARRESRNRAIAVVSAVVVTLLIVIGGYVIIRTAKDNRDQKIAEQTAPPANLTDGGFLVGNASAKVTVEMYEDMQCPACKNFESLDGKQLNAWAADGTVKLMYRPIAFLDDKSSTKYSTRALNALAAVINAKPAAFPKFHTLLFENQPEEGGSGLPDSQLIDLAVQAGVDKAAVESAITGLKYEGWTKTATQGFYTKGYTSTPTILINGKKLDDYAPDKLKAMVDAAKKG